MGEAAFVAAKQLVALVCVAGMARHVCGDASRPFRLFLLTTALSLAGALAVLALPPTHRLSAVFIRWNETVAIGLLIAAVAAVYLGIGSGEPGGRIDEPGTARGLSFAGTLAWALLPPIFFSPDWGGAVAYLRGLSALRGGNAVLGGIVLGAASGLVLAGLGARALRRVPPAWRWFGLPQILLFLAGLKLATGGVQGYAEYSMIPSIQRIFMKLSHDVVHHLFTILMVPDHPLLKVSTWNFIGFFFGSNFGLMVTLGFLLLPPGAFLVAMARAPVAYPDGLETRAERRLHRAGVRFDRLRRSTVVWVFCLLVLGSWFVRGSGEISTIYDPEPRPVVADAGFIVIPRTDPTMNLDDGAIHKFSYLDETRTLRFLVLRKPGGRLAVCLDACEICPPEGYGQEGDHVVCLFCNTPIPSGTLGTPGGCNPIPVAARISDHDIRIAVDELVKRWNEVDSGKTREEAIPR